MPLDGSIIQQGLVDHRAQSSSFLQVLRFFQGRKQNNHHQQLGRNVSAGFGSQEVAKLRQTHDNDTTSNSQNGPGFVRKPFTHLHVNEYLSCFVFERTHSVNFANACCPAVAVDPLNPSTPKFGVRIVGRYSAILHVMGP